MKNWLLKQKMDALAWLARANSFVSEDLCQKMAQAFRTSEVPLHQIEMRQVFMAQTTES